ncbi:MAG: type II toxin-antitoxin system RelE/ParE family toxin [Chitinophagaceae bacterium]
MGRQKKKTPASFQIRLSQNALQNLDEITGYIAFINHQPINAIKVGDAMFATFEKIKANPFAFKECAELPTKNKIYRRAVCYSWSVIYKITTTEIIILGIIHHSRRPSAIKKLRKIK